MRDGSSNTQNIIFNIEVLVPNTIGLLAQEDPVPKVECLGPNVLVPSQHLDRKPEDLVLQ